MLNFKMARKRFIIFFRECHTLVDTGHVGLIINSFPYFSKYSRKRLERWCTLCTGMLVVVTSFLGTAHWDGATCVPHRKGPNILFYCQERQGRSR
jgi:hypothetical protein